MGRKNQRKALVLAGALFVGIGAANTPALAATAALEQTPAVAPTDAPALTIAPVVTVSIPTIDAVGSSIDGKTLKAIFGGDVAAHGAELAKLNATSIHVPEITVTLKNGTSSAGNISYVYKDLDLESVTNGVAQSATVGSTEALTGAATLKFGKISTGLFDIGGLLAFYGVVPGSATQPLKTIYKDFNFAGGTFSGPDFACNVGEASAAEVKARPLKVPFADLIKAISAANVEKNDPSPATLNTLVGFYADFFTAFESSPMVLKSVDCSGKDEKGDPLKFSVGPVTIGGFGKARYPSIEAQNFSLDMGPAGHMNFGSATMKSFDLSGPIAAVQNAGTLSVGWFNANARKLIPSFEGFGFTNLDMDVPDEEHPGERIKASVKDFDLSLADYFQGIPTTINTSAHHIVAVIPPAVPGTADDFDNFRDLGIKKFDLGFNVDVHRDAAAHTIIVDHVALNGADLGSFDLSGTVGNVSDVLFSGDKNSTLLAAVALTVKSLKVDVVDAGLADIMFKRAGSEQGMDVAATRSSMSGVAQGAILVTLGGTPEAKAIGEAVGKFVAGAKSLTLTAVSKDPAGLSLADFTAAQANPTAFSAKVTIDATAK